MINQYTKFEVSRFTRYEAMNDSAKCRKWDGIAWLGGTRGRNATIRQSASDFLFDFNRNSMCIFFIVFEI